MQSDSYTVPVSRPGESAEVYAGRCIGSLYAYAQMLIAKPTAPLPIVKDGPLHQEGDVIVSGKTVEL